MLISIENTRADEWHTLTSHLCEWLDLSFATIRDFQEPLSGSLAEQVAQMGERQKRWQRFSDCVILSNYQYPHLLIHYPNKEVSVALKKSETLRMPSMAMVLLHADESPEVSQAIYDLASRRNMKFPTRIVHSVGKDEVWEQFKALSEALAHRLG